MTRINCVPPNELTNKHLVAEYRELPRVRHAYPRKTAPTIPATYRMGKGHVTFFYNKGQWLVKRHDALIHEMRNRNFTVNMPPLNLDHWPIECMQDWQPNATDLQTNRQRLSKRLGQQLRTDGIHLHNLYYSVSMYKDAIVVRDSYGHLHVNWLRPQYERLRYAKSIDYVCNKNPHINGSMPLASKQKLADIIDSWLNI